LNKRKYDKYTYEECLHGTDEFRTAR
jgi:hypothetical protein